MTRVIYADVGQWVGSSTGFSRDVSACLTEISIQVSIQIELQSLCSKCELETQMIVSSILDSHYFSLS
jgi:hypothetical protein